MGEDLIETIKKEIRKTGHPLSLEISRTLNQKKWAVRNGPRYFSKDINTFREIDIVSFRSSLFLKDAIDILVIECKKSEKDNWVFFKQTHKNRDPYTLNIAQSDGTVLTGKIYSWLEHKKLFEKHYYFNRALSTYFFIPCADPDNEKRGKVIDKAINQVIQATLFYLGQREGKDGKTGFYYPIIVFDGKLFEAILTEGEMKVEEVNHISLLVDIEMSEPIIVKNIDNSGIGRYLLSKKFIIDIVKKDNFENFLENFN
jgi:hypothetical protein